MEVDGGIAIMPCHDGPPRDTRLLVLVDPMLYRPYFSVALAAPVIHDRRRRPVYNISMIMGRAPPVSLNDPLR